MASYEMTVHEAFVEFQLHGVMDAAGHFGRAEIEAIDRLKKVLMNYEDLEKITVDADALIGPMQRLAALGYRIAVYAPDPVQFGMARAIGSWAGISADLRQVFSDRESAVAWLLEEVPAARRTPARGAGASRPRGTGVG